MARRAREAATRAGLAVATELGRHLPVR